MEHKAVFSKITSFLGFSYKRHCNPDRPHENSTWCSTLTAVDMWEEQKTTWETSSRTFSQHQKHCGGTDGDNNKQQQ